MASKTPASPPPSYTSPTASISKSHSALPPPPPTLARPTPPSSAPYDAYPAISRQDSAAPLLPGPEESNSEAEARVRKELPPIKYLRAWTYPVKVRTPSNNLSQQGG
ncbi:hypothetical protein CALVIDRAFT_539917 [Calocera viscosa TUFC12733]|uniref:Uncharacterized protein n=1 Tax=Calocera viscosa (strain TUFC12733) TaxID=1330018 RepID=A0A167JCY5_CALVF|nr:hypothetical protein CALVIDRAFT_539917 [Calocera viscosa TUFC12733]